MVNAYLFLLALVALERGFELVLSARHARQALARGAREEGARHTRVMIAVHALFLPACAAEVLLLGRPFLPAIALPALAGVLLAQGLRYWAVLALGARWNVRVLAKPGADPVTRGPYRWVRHPNYLAVVVELACLPLIHGAWWTAAAFSLANAVLLTGRIRIEESALGPRYQAAFAGRPRLLPGGRHGP